MHNNDLELVDDYEWFHNCMLLALSKIEAACSQSFSPSSGDSPPPQDGPDPASMSPRAPSTSLLVIPAASRTQAVPHLGCKCLPCLLLLLTLETVLHVGLMPA